MGIWKFELESKCDRYKRKDEWKLSNLQVKLPQKMPFLCSKNLNFFLKFLLGQGPFCGATGTLCFRLQMTLPMSFKVRVDQSLPALFCHLCTMIPRVISGCQVQASNLDHSLWRQAQFHCTSPTQNLKKFSKILDTSLYHFAKGFIDILHGYQMVDIWKFVVSEHWLANRRATNAFGSTSNVNHHLKIMQDISKILWQNNRFTCLVFFVIFSKIFWVL